MKKYLYFILPFIYIFADQITKLLVIKNIPYRSFIKINDYFSIVNVSNTGTAFSMFSGNNLIFIFLISAIVVFLVFFICKNKNMLTKIQTHCLLLILAGGIGNLIDRIFRGSVVDFIDVGYKEVYRWPSFNVADSCVCIGVFVFIFFGLRNKTKNEK